MRQQRCYHFGLEHEDSSYSDIKIKWDYIPVQSATMWGNGLIGRVKAFFCVIMLVLVWGRSAKGFLSYCSIFARQGKSGVDHARLINRWMLHALSLCPEM